MSLIPLKMLESEYWEANNLQDSNSRKSYLQEQGKESTASGNTSGKNVKERFMEKTKITNNVKTASLSHSTKQDNSNSNISNRIKETRNSIGPNNKGLEDKKMPIFHETIQLNMSMVTT